MPLRTGLIVLVASLGLGCFAFDEIDEAMEKLGHGKKADARDTSSEPRPASEWRRSTSNWWKQAKTLSSEAPDADIKRCALGGSEQFMSEADCLARGGSPR